MKPDQDAFNSYARNDIVPGRQLCLTEVPPIVSANDMWTGQNIHGRRIKTPRYKEWLEEASVLMAVNLRRYAKSAGTPMEVWVIAPFSPKYFSSATKIKRDCDNLIKPVCDALKTGGVIEDDDLRHITAIHVVPVCSSRDIWPVVAIAPNPPYIFP